MAKFTGHPITDDSALGGSVIERSLRFNSSDAAHLTRTPSSTGNQKVWTWSAWVKRAKLGANQYLFVSNETNGSGDGIAGLYFGSNDRLKTYYDTSGSHTYGDVNSRKYRDTNAWMNIVWQVDAANTTQRIWINGVEETGLSNNPIDYNYSMNQSGHTNMIGSSPWNTSSAPSDMYIAEVNHIDGSLIAPTEFGFTESQTGIWMPKRYEGTYGTNGFYLDFSDNSSTAALGIDKSPNGNDFTVNNFSVSAGTGNDSFTMTPTATNEFATLNPNLPKASGAEYRNGSYTFYHTAGAHMRASSNMPVNSGKWYAEFLLGAYTFASGSYPYIGVCPDDRWVNTWAGDTGTALNSAGTMYRNGSTFSGGGVSYAEDDIISVAMDLDQATPQVWWAKNGTYINSGNPATNTNGADIGPTSYTGYYNFSLSLWAATGAQWDANFGQRAFSYSIPDGFKTLCTDNIRPNQNIIPKKHFDTLTWTGDDSSDRNIEGLEFKPDMVWIKNRSQTDFHVLQDSVRGANKLFFPNDTDVEQTDSANGHVNYFTSGGFNVTAGSAGFVNENSENYVAWCWKAGGAAVSNSDGTITSSISVNQEAGFSIVSYTGNGTSGATVGHGLGKKPAWIILIRRDSTDNRYIYHQQLNLGSNPEQHYSELNFHAGATDSNKIHNDTAPTTSVFSLSNDNASNGNTYPYIAYCWAEIPGYSKFGYYQATGVDTDGPYVHLGFRPAWVMIKSMSLSNSDWTIFDNKRNTSNPANNHLAANQNHAEASDNYEIVDFYSNGFKVTGLSGSAINYNTSYPQLIYMAFAEQPALTAFDQANPNAR